MTTGPATQPAADATQWRRSSSCNAGDCVEVADVGGRIGMRSASFPAVVLWFRPDEWREFLTGVRNGEFDAEEDPMSAEPMSLDDALAQLRDLAMGQGDQDPADAEAARITLARLAAQQPVWSRPPTPHRPGPADTRQTPQPSPTSWRRHFLDANERLGEALVAIGMALGLPRPTAQVHWGAPEILAKIREVAGTPAAEPAPDARDRLIETIEAAWPGETVWTRDYGAVPIAPDTGDLADALIAAGYRAGAGVPTDLVPLVPAGDLEVLREALCGAQSALGLHPARAQSETWSRRLGEVIAAIDAHRPLGPDGKHGDRHTATCGCEDVDAGAPTEPAPGDNATANAIAEALMRRYGHIALPVRYDAACRAMATCAEWVAGADARETAGLAGPADDTTREAQP